MLGAVLGPALESALLAFLLASAAAADTVRVATFDVGLTRDGAGVLLRDLADPDPTTAAIATVIRAVRPDVLLLTGFDTDLRGRALAAFAALLDAGPDGIDYPHSFTAPVNAGEPSGHDLDGDGRTMGCERRLRLGQVPRPRRHGDPVAAADRHRGRADLPSVALGRPAGRRTAGAHRRHAVPRRGGAGGAPAVVALALGRAGAGGRHPAAPARGQPDAAALRRRRGLQPPAQPRRAPALVRLPRRRRAP